MLVGRSGMSPVMVGRDAELDRLSRLLHQAPPPAVALVSGEPGIGKSRLLQELVKSVAGSETTVLVGQADPGALGRPFELLLDVVEGHTAERGDLTELAGLVADPMVPSDRRLRAALDLLRQLVHDRRALVVFEDLHWADAESITVFERFAESSDAAVLLVGTYRPDAVTRRHPLAELLPHLERRRSVTQLRLERLTAPDVGAFLGAITANSPSFRVVDSLHTRTGGNPFFLEELVKDVPPGQLDDFCALPLPWNLAEAVRNQLDDLAPHERRIAETAAVLGRKVSFDLLATVTRTTESELIDILRDLVAQGLMVEIDDDYFSFRHALAREAIEGALLGRERRRIHEAALEALLEVGSTDHVAIAHHAQGAGRYDDLVRAARRGTIDSLAIGSSYQALQLAELGLSEAPDDTELLALAARAAWLVGLVDAPAGHAERWLGLSRQAHDRNGIAAALRVIVRLAWDRVDVARFESATKELTDFARSLPPSDEQARVMAAIAQSHMLQNNAAEAIEWADRAIELADKLDLPVVRIAGLLEKGSSQVMATRRDAEGRSVLEQVTAGQRMLLDVADEAERLGEPVLVARALNNAVFCARRLGADEVNALLERMRAAAERAGFDALATAHYVDGQAMVAELRGDLGAARAALERGRRTGRGLVMPAVSQLDYHGHRAGLALEAGDLERAEEIVAILQEAGFDPARSAGVVGLVFHVACRRGDLATARTALAEFLAAAGDRHDAVGLESTHDLVSAGLAAGLDPSELRPLVDRLDREFDTELDTELDRKPTVGRSAATDELAWQALLEAQLSEAEGDHERALVGYRAAIRSGEGDLFPYHLGTAHVGAARCLIALDQLSDARAEIEAARPLLASWGGWRGDELHAVERRLGIGDAVDGPAALTPREREVVALLAEGLTNAELAERLYISPKTAAVHVSNILAKLGMTTRTEVAAWAIREALDPS